MTKSNQSSRSGGRHRGAEQTRQQTFRLFFTALAAPAMAAGAGGTTAAAIALDQPIVAIAAGVSTPVPLVITARRSKTRGRHRRNPSSTTKTTNPITAKKDCFAVGEETETATDTELYTPDLETLLRNLAIRVDAERILFKPLPENETEILTDYPKNGAEEKPEKHATVIAPDHQLAVINRPKSTADPTGLPTQEGARRTITLCLQQDTLV